MENNSENNENERSQNYKKANYTLSFFVLLLINGAVFFCENEYELERSQFSISLWPIINKHQYYRMITHYFFHFGFFHLLIDMIFLFNLCKIIEKQIGTLFTLAFISQALLLISCIYLIMFFFIKHFLRLFSLSSYNFRINFLSECGMSPLLFAIYTYYFLFSKHRDKTLNIFFVADIRIKYSGFAFLLFISFFTPNESFFGHLSGIFCGYLIKKFLGKYSMPKVAWVKDFEESWSLCRNEIFYINIINKDQNFLNDVSEIEMNYLDFPKNDSGYAEEQGREMAEIQGDEV